MHLNFLPKLRKNYKNIAFGGQPAANCTPMPDSIRVVQPIRLQHLHQYTSRILLIRNIKQLLDEVFVISGIIKAEVSVISRSRRLRLITLTEILIIPDITKTESNNCFIIHCYEENNDKRIIANIIVYFQTLKTIQLSDKQIFTVFIKQSSAEKLNAFLKKVSLNLYLQVIS